ncbi:MAG: BrnT family toxin, partial [Acidobacteria bacterium]|nr:BrnT family toxin [Acidobacteriota bacterium]
ETFLDPFFRVVDAGVIEDEQREAIIGLTVDWRLLFVVYVMRQDSVRIVSARPATEKERREYENQ